MSNLTIISTTLDEYGISTAGSIIQDPSNEAHFFVYVAVNRDANNQQNPSNRRLRKVFDVLAPQGVTVEFLLSDAGTQDIEAGLRATLLHAFGNEIRNVFLSIENSKAFIWLDQKRDQDETFLGEVEKKSRFYLENLDLELVSLLTTKNANLPGKLACLNLIRQLSPVSAEILQNELQDRGFKIPSSDWLNRRLDLLRKSQQIIRLSNAKYVLSKESLTNLGTSRNRNSPDIIKMLALARMNG